MFCSRVSAQFNMIQGKAAKSKLSLSKQTKDATTSTSKNPKTKGKEKIEEKGIFKACKVQQEPTITSREIQTTVRLVLLIELAKHAVSEGTKAVTKFTSS
ncbi:hypothetical protein IFM89_032717 [Coptis chinensis]|uniref:Histone H2B n=1 Tax=Coptis chinensis TaxID=261450 RepID=A0A835M581_9MAGN|nr:hypothetical protein IFM89_032717 [Coptis chinensis]